MSGAGRIAEIIDEIQPDVVVEDNVISFPALLASGRPWVRIVSCSPAEIRNREVPPAFSGYPTADRSRWPAFHEEYARTHAVLHAEFDVFCRARGAPPLPELEFIHASPWLNLWLYPDEVDYKRSPPLDGGWRNLEASVRATDVAWQIPASLIDDEDHRSYI